MSSNSTQFKVSMLFTGTDQLSPTTRKMIENMKSVQKQAQSMMSGGGMQAPKMFDDMSRVLKNLSGQIDTMHKKMKDMKSEGFHDILAGGAAIASIVGPVKKAGDIQMQGTLMGGIYGLDETSDKIKEIKNQAKELSGLTLFSQKEILGMGLELGRAQISKESLQKVLPESTYFAEVEQLAGKSSSPERSAYNFARMAEDSQITNDTARMQKFADSMFRVINVTHASSESLGETFKYAMQPLRQLGWNENDMLQASALAAVNGMEGSMAGTHIKDFGQRINPYKFIGTKGGQKQIDAMAEAGLLGGVKYDKTGHVINFANAALMNGTKGIKSYAEMIDILTQKHKDFLATGKGEAQWAATMNHIFGEQGQDIAIISSHKEVFDKLNTSLTTQKGLHETVDTVRDKFNGQIHILHSQFENLTTAVGNHLLPEVTDLARELTPMVKTASQWVDTHKDGVVVAGKVVGAFGVLMLSLGASKIAVGTIGSLILGPFKTGLSAAADILGKLGSKGALDTLKKSLPEKAIQANVVNVYGKMVNGGAGGGMVMDPVGGGMAPGSGGKTSTTKGGGKFGEVVSLGKGVLKRGGLMAIPASLAFGAWDVMTAPEGKKVESAVKSSGTVIGGWAGAEAGAAMGAGIGTLLGGPVGTAIGGIIGGVIGAAAGSSIANSITDSILGLDKEKNRIKDMLLQEQSDQAQMVQAHRAREEWTRVEDFNKLAPKLDTSWALKLDTSKYTARENGSTKSSQKSFQDHSTNNFYISAPDPGAVQDQISGNKANLARRMFMMDNSE